MACLAPVARPAGSLTLQGLSHGLIAGWLPNEAAAVSRMTAVGEMVSVGNLLLPGLGIRCLSKGCYLTMARLEDVAETS